MKRRTVITVLLLLGTGIAFLFRLYLTMNRYFDVDEFAHYNWAFLFTLGLKPYKDFFIYHIPFFQFFLLPTFLLPKSAETVVFIRVLLFFVFFGTAIFTGLIARKLVKNQTALFMAIFIMAIFPMMIDKSIEIRPDTLMVMLFMVPLYLAFSFPTWKKHEALLSGLFFGTSVMMFQKILFAVPALAVLFLFDPAVQLLKHHTFSKETWQKWVTFSLAASLPGFFFLYYLAQQGIFQEGMYAIFTATRLVYDVPTIKFSPLLALTPWPMVYVNRVGPSFPWAVNVVILITFLGGLVMLFVERKWKAFLFYVVFFLCSYIYLYIFPTPFVQYYIPILVIGTPLAALFFTRILFLLKPAILSYVLLIVLIGLGLLSYQEQVFGRLALIDTNREQLQVIRDILNHTKPDETVYDMAGSYIYRPPGYIFCCHRYTNFIHKLTPTPPPLMESLVTRQTKFIVLDRSGFVFWLTPEPDMTFIRSSYMDSAYHKIYTVGFHYRCENGTCVRLNLDNGPVPNTQNNVIPVFIPETYKVTTYPEGKSITIGGKVAHDKESIALEKTNYTFYVSPDLAQVTIQLDR